MVGAHLFAAKPFQVEVVAVVTAVEQLTLMFPAFVLVLLRLAAAEWLMGVMAPGYQDWQPKNRLEIFIPSNSVSKPNE